MTLEEAWNKLYQPYNRFDKDLMALRIVVEDQEKRLKDLELKLIKTEPMDFTNKEVHVYRIRPFKKRGRPRKEEVHEIL